MLNYSNHILLFADLLVFIVMSCINIEIIRQKAFHATPQK